MLALRQSDSPAKVVSFQRKNSTNVYFHIFLQVLFQIALASLDANRLKLLAVEDDGEAMTILGNYLEHVTNRDSTHSQPAHNNVVSNKSIGVLPSGVRIHHACPPNSSSLVVGFYWPLLRLALKRCGLQGKQRGQNNEDKNNNSCAQNRNTRFLPIFSS